MAIINTAPIFSKMREKGGSMYTFTTTTNDFSYLFAQSDIKMIPSHFACLKLPDWSNITDQSMFIDPTVFGSPLNTDPNYAWPKMLQNYTENLIVHSEADKTDNTLANYGEQAFWKTLVKLGAMELEPTTETVVEDGITKTIHKEKARSTTYEPVVQYVGELNLINHSKVEGIENIEVLCHIPTDSGRLDGVKFKPSVVSHSTGLIPTDGGGEFTSGLDDFDGTDSVSAVYDNEVTRQYEVGSDIQDCGIWFDSIEDTQRDQGDFDFNAILVYYTIFDTNDESTRAINAYGILMLESFELITAGSGSIPSIKKYMPDDIQSGIAFTERFTLKFDSVSNQTTSEISINSYSTVSMELYMEALRRLHVTATNYNKMFTLVAEMQQTQEQMKQWMFNASRITSAMDTFDTFEQRLQVLEKQSDGENLKLPNEDVYNVLIELLNELRSTTNNQINLSFDVSPRTYLAKVLNDLPVEVEAHDGTKYVYNTTTKQYELL